MSKFDQCFELTVGIEGGYQCIQGDRGNWTSGQIGVGECKGTKYGITAMSYPSLDIINLTIDQAKSIYKRDYYDKCHCDDLPAPMSVIVFDAAVNNGADRAIKWLQTALRVTPDGVIGPITIAAVQGVGDGLGLMARYMDQRVWFMSNLPIWSNNRGWSTRLTSIPLKALRVTG